MAIIHTGIISGSPIVSGDPVVAGASIIGGEPVVTGGIPVPRFTSTPATVIIEDAAYSYSIIATGGDGSDLVITATSIPDWLTLTDNGDGTATLTGTPDDGDVGSNTVILKVTDGTGTRTQAFTIVVDALAVNNAPFFATTPVTSADEDVAYSYAVEVGDIDEDSLTLSATTKPAWLTFTDNGDGTATLAGLPENADVGEHSVVLSAIDGAITVTQSFTISVAVAYTTAAYYAPLFSAESYNTATPYTAEQY